jgi:hypothetical protein
MKNKSVFVKTLVKVKRRVVLLWATWSPGMESCGHENVEWRPFGNTCTAAKIMVLVVMITSLPGTLRCCVLFVGGKH